MLFLLPALLLLVVSLRLLRPVTTQGVLWRETAPDAQAWLLIFAGFVAMAALLGPLLAGAMVAGLALQRLGLMVGAWATGRKRPTHQSWARGWGLVPDLPGDDLHALYALLLGPSIALGPLVLATSLAEGLAPGPAQQVATYLSLGLGAAGLLALLPLWPMPGGQVLALLARALRPGAERAAMLAVTLGLIALAVRQDLPLLAGLAGLSGVVWALHPLQARPSAPPRPLPRGTRARAFGIWLAAFGAHLITGFWLFTLPL